MIQQNFGICRGCGAQILWTRTAAGKSMPCDPEVIFFTPGGGPETFVTPEGKTERGKRSKEGQIGYISHFATCPQSKRFQKKEKRYE
jgi:hypothetical protein